jgi:thiamine biosynthesis lipoprotein
MKHSILMIIFMFAVFSNIMYALETSSDIQNTSVVNNIETPLQANELISRTRSLMGTYVTISLLEKYNAQITSSFDLIQKIENALSSYDPNATLSKLNKHHTVKYDHFLAEAIQVSQNFYHETDGFFDITVGSITKKLYHFGEEKTYAPTKEELKEAHLNINGITITDTTIRSDENIVLDLGGMGKGYAVDKVIAYLKDQNITQGVIALSGDIQCIDKCDIYLQSPYASDSFAMVKSKHKFLSISTSGTYRRYANTPKDHHLINPKTAQQGRDFVSVSLFTRANNTKLDAYATAISVMPKVKAFTFLNAHKEIGYIIMTHDRKVYYDNLDDFVSLEWLEKSE